MPPLPPTCGVFSQVRGLRVVDQVSITADQRSCRVWITCDRPRRRVVTHKAQRQTQHEARVWAKRVVDHRWFRRAAPGTSRPAPCTRPPEGRRSPPTPPRSTASRGPGRTRIWRSDKLGYPQSYWRVAVLADDRTILDRLRDYLSRCRSRGQRTTVPGGTRPTCSGHARPQVGHSSWRMPSERRRADATDPRHREAPGVRFLASWVRPLATWGRAARRTRRRP